MSIHYDSAKPPEAIELLTTTQVAKIYGISPGVLQNWRSAGAGPVYVKLGEGDKAPVRYHIHDIEKYVNERRRVPSVQTRRER